MKTYTPRTDASKWRNLEPREIIQEGDEVLSSRRWIKARRIGRHPLRQSIYRTHRIARKTDPIKELQAEVEKLREALEDIANMPKIDQDDEHRLRHKAQMALATAPEEPIPDRIKHLAEDVLKLHKPNDKPQ